MALVSAIDYTIDWWIKMSSYFPMFLNLENKEVLIVGGGKIAFDKLEKLLNFTKNITVIATKFSHDMHNMALKNSLKMQKREYKNGDLKGFDIAIIAVDDINLQKRIWEESRELKTLVNVVDLPEYCDFFFGSFIKEGDLTIAISTSGSSPAVAKYLKKYLKAILPKNLNQFIDEMKNIRNKLPKGKERMEILDKKAREFFKV